MSQASDNEQAAMRAQARKDRALRKIQQWVNSDEKPFGSKTDMIKVPGLPTGNVIEERRLKEILFDLGKKRQQYISHNEYEQQRFLEAQRRKSYELRKALSDDNLSRGWSVSNRNLLTREASSYLTTENTRVGQLDKINSSSLIDKQQDVFITAGDQERNPPSQGKMVSFVSDLKKPPLADNFRQRSKSRSLDPTAVPLVPWSKMKSTSIQPGTHLPPLMEDPRFSLLEKKLSPIFHGRRKKKDLGDVIEGLDALHIPSKMKQKSRTVIGQRIRQLLKEQGIIF
ncbi:hypothetical protein KP79_PYT05317 [Mizuhopecten yessoensis]|uniref:Uncharacterized protein n=1 Tax=Mizuhopecten yessoensis TaxID=6573 RepID=A0A210PR73_MIZYE|nr:hypothetical protein KP79_PYT05317 [Mizuhopecten yessoensis]